VANPAGAGFHESTHLVSGQIPRAKCDLHSTARLNSMPGFRSDQVLRDDWLGDYGENSASGPGIS
jgi:hypothetical protein